jgi:hypothetical protein
LPILAWAGRRTIGFTIDQRMPTFFRLGAVRLSHTPAERAGTVAKRPERSSRISYRPDTHRNSWPARPLICGPLSGGSIGMDDLILKIDQNIDQILVNLGDMVLRLSDPAVTRTAEEQQALAQSANQFSVCARHSTDPRVWKLAEELADAIKPRLRLVASR